MTQYWPESSYQQSHWEHLCDSNVEKQKKKKTVRITVKSQEKLVEPSMLNAIFVFSNMIDLNTQK